MFSNQNIVYISPFSYACYLPHPISFSLILSHTVISETNTLGRSSFCSLLHPPATLSLLGPKYSPQHPDLIHLQFMFFLSVRDQFSHQYKTTGKIMLLYIVRQTVNRMIANISHI